MGIGGRYGRDEMVYRLMPGKRPRFCDQSVFAFLYSYLRALRERNGTDVLSSGMGADFWPGYSVAFGLGTEVGQTIYIYIIGLYS